MREIRSPGLAGLAGAVTVGAGLVHAAAAGTHGGDITLVRLFAAAAVVQVVAGALLVSRPSPRAVAGVAVVNLALVGAWIASRTVGIPFIAGVAEPEAVGLQDLTVTIMEAVAALAAIGSLRFAHLTRAAVLSPVWMLALAPTFVGVTAQHAHGAGGVHDHGGDNHAAQTADHHATGGLAADPIFSGADTSHATEPELRVAADLILRTRQSVRTLFPDEESVVAAGYTSIGDGFLFSSYEHFINHDYLTDGRELDPTHIESIVVESTPTGKWVASAMYILERGRGMAEVPTDAGPLTTWHDHQNICWDPSGTRMAGFVRNGTCVPGGTFRETPPMLHVWMRDNACGPFAGVEGHGTTSCAHAHSAS